MSLAEHKKHKIALKDQHMSQLAKLTFKSEADIEFFETVRDYMKARAEIEQQHSKVMSIFDTGVREIGKNCFSKTI
jgi:hypothetical protein